MWREESFSSKNEGSQRAPCQYRQDRVIRNDEDIDKMNTIVAILTGALIALALFYEAAPAQAATATHKPFIYQETLLVGDKPGIGKTIDPALVDPWGMAFQPNGVFWVADRAKGVATLYDGDGRRRAPAIVIPNPAGGPNPVAGPAGVRAGPTGLVWNPSQGFAVSGAKVRAHFILATLQGTIAAWAPNLPGEAVTVVNNARVGAVYTGLAFGVMEKGAFLYAANIHAGRIDVFDAAFRPVALPGKFLDPNIPADFAPFNVQAIGGNLVVTYARRNAAKNFVVPGKGAGFVDIFDTSGNLVRRVAAGGALNAPWGVALAPAGFGGASGKLVIGNFGDGHILAVDQTGGAVDEFRDILSGPIVVPGLWALGFGGGAGSDPRTLYFTSGLLLELDGAFGMLTAVDPLAF